MLISDLTLAWGVLARMVGVDSFLQDLHDQMQMVMTFLVTQGVYCAKSVVDFICGYTQRNQSLDQDGARFTFISFSLDGTCEVYECLLISHYPTKFTFVLSHVSLVR